MTGRPPRAPAPDSGGRLRLELVAALVSPLRASQAGGAQSVVADLARALAKGGDDVEVVAAPGSRLAGVRLHLAPAGPFPQSRLRLHASSGTWESGEPDSRQDEAFAAAARRSAARRALFHGHAMDAAAFAAPTVAGVAAVHTLHLAPVDVAATAAAAAAATRGARFVAVSRALAESWRPHLDVTVIHNGVDPARYPVGAGAEHAVAVIAGRVSPEKGTDLAIRAALLAGMRVVLAGPVYDPQYWSEIVEPMVDGDSVRTLGPLTRRRLHRLMGEASVVVCAPRWEEPFGMVALEAAMTGTPVASLARGALPEVLGPESGVLADGDDEAALARAVVAAAALDRGRVRADVSARLGIESTVARYRAVYATVSAPGGGRSLDSHQETA